MIQKLKVTYARKKGEDLFAYMHVFRLNFKTNTSYFRTVTMSLSEFGFAQWSNALRKDDKDYKKHQLNIGELHTAATSFVAWFCL